MQKVFQSVAGAFDLKRVRRADRDEPVGKPDGGRHTVDVRRIAGIQEFRGTVMRQIEEGEVIEAAFVPIEGVEILPAAVVYDVQKGSRLEMGVLRVEGVRPHNAVEQAGKSVVRYDEVRLQVEGYDGLAG